MVLSDRTRVDVRVRRSADRQVPSHRRANAPDRPVILVDGHVHFHEVYDAAAFFDAAVENFRRGARTLGAGDAWAGVMILTDGAGQRWFSRFRQDAGGGVTHGPWTFVRTREEHSLILQRHDGERLALIAGRQLVSAEDLEVLEFPASTESGGVSSLSDVLVAAREADRMAVIPWGFGKWWLGRRRVLRESLEGTSNDGVYLADSGNRPWFLPYPRVLRWARSTARIVLAGSDPLPLRGHERRAGSYGFQLAGPLDYDGPAACVVGRLRGLRRNPPIYGELEGLVPFVRSQLEMQAVKWTRQRNA